MMIPQLNGLINENTSDKSFFSELRAFVKTAVEKCPELLSEWIKITERHGRKFAIDRWLDE